MAVRRRSEGRDPVRVEDDLAEFRRGLKGGQKYHLLRKYREMILQFNKLFGDEDTMERFNMTTKTLENLKRDSQYPRLPPMPTKLERAFIQSDIAVAESRDAVVRVQSLEVAAVRNGDHVTIKIEIPVNTGLHQIAGIVTKEDEKRG